MLDFPEYKDRLKDPYNAPKGSILVYSGTNMHGHIEIKVGDAGDGGFVSDYFSNDARTGHSTSARGRTLIGVYVKI